MKDPTDAGLVSHGVRALAREGRKLAERIGERKRRGAIVRGRSASAACDRPHHPQALGRGEGASARVHGSDRRAASAVGHRGAPTGRARPTAGSNAQAKLKAAVKHEQPADRCEKVARQIRRRVHGQPITDRIVSLANPDARPIRNGKLGKPNEFGYVPQLAELTRAHQARRAE